MMSNIIYRDIETGDIPSIKKAIANVWEWAELIEDEDTLDATLSIYLNQVLHEATFGRVAVLDGNVVGVIFGIAFGKEPVYRHLLADGFVLNFDMPNASERDKFAINTYFAKLDEAYDGLIDGIKDEYGGTLDFLVLNEDAQGLGIGKGLWLALKSYFDKNGVEAIYLYSDEDCNFGFYDHQGFKQRKRQPTLFDFGVYQFTSDQFLFEYRFATSKNSTDNEH